jgi:hypothetical protein
VGFWLAYLGPQWSMSVIAIFRHLRQHPGGGGSYNFLLADDTPTDISCGSSASPTARTRLFGTGFYWAERLTSCASRLNSG